MRSSKFILVPTLLFAALAAAALVDCGGDDTGDTSGAGGTAGTSSGTAGSAGSTTTGASGSSTGGSTGTAGGGGAGSTGVGGTGGTGGGGSAGSGGKAGAGGAEAGADAADACGIHGVIHTAPTVPSGIAVPAGSTLVGGYAAAGFQIYTCTRSVLTDGDGGDAGVVGNWVNTATATLTGDNCATAAQHTFSPGPTWTATDGSAVSAAKNNSSPAPLPDGGDGGASAIVWVLLQKTGNVANDAGAGSFANVTWVQRVNTSGGLGPSGACDPAIAGGDGGTLKVPYTADYFFYTGGTSVEAGSDAASEAGTEAGADASDDGSADSGG